MKSILINRNVRVIIRDKAKCLTTGNGPLFKVLLVMHLFFAPRIDEPSQAYSAILMTQIFGANPARPWLYLGYGFGGPRRYEGILNDGREY